PSHPPASPLSLHDALPISGRAPPQIDSAEKRPARGYIAFAAIAGPTPRPGAKASAPLPSLHVGRRSCLARLIFLHHQDRTIARTDRKSTRLNSSHQIISYA